MKRPIFSSDSSSDEIDLSKIKEKYQSPKKVAKKQKTKNESKTTKESKSDEKQMDIKSAFANATKSKRKPETTLDSFLNKKPKTDEKVIVTPESFFSTSKAKQNQVSTNKVVASSPAKVSPTKTANKQKECSPKIEEKPIETTISSPKASIRKSVASDISSPMSSSNKISYAKFMHRSGPQALGSKEIPEGSPNCLIGLIFVITGVLDSIERDDAQSLIERCGGKVTKSVSGRTSYLVVGTEPGESKIQKANQCKTKQINEDELFDLIRTSSSKMSHNVKPSTTKIVSNSSIPANSEDIKEKLDTKEEKKVERKAEKNIITKEEIKPTHTAQSLSANPIIQQTREVCSSLFVDKYRPTTAKKIVGQHGARSPANKLMIWLKNFEKNLKLNVKSDEDGSQFRAALLSGPPGIGKTTTAQLVCHELGYKAVELNASSVRSKKSIQSSVSDSMSSLSFSQNKDLKHCLIMDEVDGMAGNEDRGGINELIQIIKTTKHPIICICNDRQSRKLQSFVKYVYDIRYPKLTPDQVKATLLSVAFKEKINLPEDAVNYIIKSSNFDMRQVLNNLQMWSAGSMESETLKTDAKNACKEFKLGPFDVLPKVFSHENVKTFSEKSDLFFQDYQLGGLFVQENYPMVRPNFAKGDINTTMKLMSLAADSISMGDIVSTKIRTDNDWSLLPTQAMFASVIPGEYLHGRLTARIEFPSWLGKFSKTNKNARILSSLCSHLCLSTQCGVFNPSTIALDYGELLVKKLTNPLREGDIETVLNTLNKCQLLKEDMDLLIEATCWSHLANPMGCVSTQTKSALTRAYNKSNFKLPYANISVKKSLKSTGASLDPEIGMEIVDEEEETAVEEEEELDDIGSDVMIVKKIGSKKSASKIPENKAVSTKKSTLKKVTEPKVVKEKKTAAIKKK